MRVAIAIPIYKEVLSSNEVKVLNQIRKILSKYEVFFFGPDNLNIESYLKIHPTAKWIPFDKKYFRSIIGYSQLMLSPGFYKKYKQFDYILLHQLDAWVFEDKLIYWCEKAYDYIGAPWIEKPPLINGKPIVDLTGYFINKVGNGGLSLRKVKSHYINTIIFSPILKFFIKNEDMFWGLFIDFLNPFFKKPKYMEALDFAFEMNPAKAFEMNDKKLPFGVHAWEKYDFHFWDKHIY
jgi:Protein of unknown function (DUF5672)